MKVALDIQGIDQLFANLRKLADDRTATKITQDAFKSGAAPILAEAEQNIPVDTGAAKKNLRIKSTRRRGRVTVKVGEGNRGEFFFLSMVEYGHAVGKLDKETKRLKDRARRFKGREDLAAKLGIDLTVNDKRQFVKARPFLRPAVDHQGPAAASIIAAQIAAALDAAFGV